MPWQVVHHISGRIRIKGPLRVLQSFSQLEEIIDGLQSIAGVRLAGYSLRTQTILFTYDRQNNLNELTGFLIQKTETLPAVVCRQPMARPSLPALIRKGCIKFLSSGLLKKLLANVFSPGNPIPGFLLRKCCLPPVLRYGWALVSAIPYVVKGVDTLLQRRLTVPVLDASALVTAFLRRDFASIGTITFLFSLSGYLEHSTQKKSRLNLAAGLKLLENKECWVYKNGQEEKAALAQIKPGDLLVLRSGDEVPVDGSIEDGEAMVNQASMTGESMPQRKTAGAWLYAGTALEEGRVLLKAVNVHGETRISRIIGFIDQAEKLKAEVQMKAETRADALVPYSFAGAGLVGLLTRDSQKVASVLMVDYSCAIRLSTSLSILSAMQSGVDNGLVIKGGKFLESLAYADTVVFDKTGTLTSAAPQVAEVLSFSSAYDVKEILRLAACLEEHYPHPLGRAVVEYADQKNLKHREEHAQVEYIAAHGIVSRLNNERVLLGSEHFLMEDEGIAASEDIRRYMQSQAALGRSLLYLAMGRNIVGLLAISDPPRHEARQVISYLHAMGLKTHMLTGDGQETAHAVARELGIENFSARMLPADKAAYMQKLKDQGHRIIMVGDGINDSPALALADVGVSLQDAADLARNVADVVLSRNDLHDLLKARQLGSLALKRIHNNYVGIVAINSLLLALGISGAITPAGSALMHNSATIISAFNSMRPFKLG